MKTKIDWYKVTAIGIMAISVVFFIITVLDMLKK